MFKSFEGIFIVGCYEDEVKVGVGQYFQQVEIGILFDVNV